VVDTNFELLGAIEDSRPFADERFPLQPKPDVERGFHQLHPPAGVSFFEVGCPAAALRQRPRDNPYAGRSASFRS
jgi:hypothetical protein